MIREYQIKNKIKDFSQARKGEILNTVLIHTETGHVVHISKEYVFQNRNKPAVSIGIAEASAPEKVLKATFESKAKLDMFINILTNHRKSFEEDAQ